MKNARYRATRDHDCYEPGRVFRAGRRSTFGSRASRRASSSRASCATTSKRPAALALLKLNLEFYDKSASTYQTIGQLSLASGDTAAALDALKKASALQPNNPQVRQMLQRLGVTP